MGLSVAVAGGISFLAIFFIISLLADMTNSMNNEVTTRTEFFKNINEVSKTKMNITSIEGGVGVDWINLNFTNVGNEKLWNYKKFDIIVTYDADVMGTKKRITETFSYNAKAGFQKNSPSLGGSSVHLRPNSDISNPGNWNDDASNTCPGDGDNVLWNELDEPITDGCNTAVESANNPTLANFTVGLTDTSDPNNDLNHVIRFDARKDDSTRTLTLFAELYEAGTLIATTGVLTLTQAFQTQTYTLNDVTETANIGNYNDLELRFVPDTSGVGAANRVLLSWAELQVPGVSSIVVIDGLQPKNCSINQIFNDNLDRRILNTQETAQKVCKLSYPIFLNGFLEVSITTDNGVVESDSIVVT